MLPRGRTGLAISHEEYLWRSRRWSANKKVPTTAFNGPWPGVRINFRGAAGTNFHAL